MTASTDSSFTTRPDIRGSFGVASATHWLASQTAMRMLELDGNAFDAAVAAGFVLQVAEPHLNGPLGEVPIIFHHAETGTTRVVCGQATAPAKATIEYFENLGLDQVPGTGLLAAAIPGAFDAWMLMLRDYGTLPLEVILQPAIDYATHGIPCVPRLAASITTLKQWFIREWPSNAEIYLVNGEVPEVGSLIRNPALARTWQRTLTESASENPDRVAQIDSARALWKTGFVAEEIVNFCQTQSFRDVTGDAHGGLLEMDDLANWSASYEEPLRDDFNGYQVCKCGPWSQGPVLLQGLSLVTQLDLSQTEADSADFYHKLGEVMKLCYADRETYYGDPDFVTVPVAGLLSPDYARERADMINEPANNQWRPGIQAGHGYPIDYEAACNVSVDDALMILAGIGEPTSRKPESTDEQQLKGMVQGDTCHVNVIDRHGNMVSATPSGGWMESSPVIPSLGFCLGTRLQMMRLEPKASDSLQPGKRPRTTLTPTLILNSDDSGYMVCGTPGGDKQDQWQLAFLVRHLLYGMTPQAAIDAPGFHCEHWPDSFYPRRAKPGKLVIENRAGDAVIAELSRRGHQVETGGPWTEGWVCASYRTPDGQLGAAASPRGVQAYASGR